jgi:hypothetical protein
VSLFSDILKSLLSWLNSLTVVGIVASTAQAFDWFDGMLSDTARAALSRWLKNTPSDSDLDSWAKVFPSLISSVFGPKALSPSCFVRSCVASIVGVLLLVLLTTRIGAIYGMPPLIENRAIPYFFLFGSVANFIPDYFSLLLSRYIVRLMAEKPTVRKTVGFLVVDFSLTALLSWLGLTFAFTLLIALYALTLHEQVALQDFVHSLKTAQIVLLKSGVLALGFNQVGAARDRAEPGIFFYSAFFTSLWVWLYVSSGFIVKALSKVFHLWNRAVPFLNIDKKPLTSMGRVAGLLLGALYAVFLAVLYLGKHVHR